MEKIDTDYKRRIEKLRLNFSICTNRNWAPLSKYKFCESQGIDHTALLLFTCMQSFAIIFYSEQVETKETTKDN